VTQAIRRLHVLVLGVGGNVSQSIQKALALAATPTREEGVRWEVSITRAGSAIGYRPRRSLEDSIAAAADAVRAASNSGATSD
jgi:nucleoside-diphosphate-sugar epimerase